MKADSKSEGDFQYILRETLEGSKPVTSLLEHSVFKRKAKLICYSIQKGKEWDAKNLYDVEDLYQDICLKVLKHQDVLIRSSNNIPDENAFFSWLFVLARNLIRSKTRRTQKTKSLINLSVEEIDITDPSISLDEKYLLSEFLEDIKTLPEDRQRAIKLWLTGYTYRDISEILSNEGIKNSHVTVRNWVRDALDRFTKIH